MATSGGGLKVAIGGNVDRNPGPNPGCLVGLNPGPWNPGSIFGPPVSSMI